MLKNYIKIAFRNLVKNRSHTLLNIGGLTLGLGCAIVIFLVIQYEYSFDSWHADSDRIYRVVRVSTAFGETEYDRGMPHPLPEAVRSDISGIEAVTILDRSYPTPVLTAQTSEGSESKFKEENTAFVQQDYFEIFTYTWLGGDPVTALAQPNTAVITESLAEKLFGNENPVGQTLTLQTVADYELEVTGLVQDPPRNTDLPLTLMVSYHSRNTEGGTRGNDNWGTYSSETESYVKLASGVAPEEVNRQFDPLIRTYQDEEAAGNLDYFLQPLSEIHFDARFGLVNRWIVEEKTLIAFGLIGLFLLITACINFINLNTAIAVKRAKEVGLRKTMGGTRGQLTLYFLGETAMITFCSTVVALALAEFFMPNLETVLGYVPEFQIMGNYALFLFLLILYLAITLAAGWYPARYLSGFSPTEAMNSSKKANYGTGLNLRRGLIVTQFTITQVLIICALVISSQMEYFQSRDMGFEKEAVVEVPIPVSTEAELDRFKNRLETETGILSTSYSNTGAINGTWGGSYIFEAGGTRQEEYGAVKFIEPGYLDTYGIDLLTGRNVMPSDTVREYLVNETFARSVGYGDRHDELLGQSVEFWGREAPIVGVVRDFNTRSLHQPVDPVLLGTERDYRQAGIRIDMSRTGEVLETIEEAFNVAFPEYVFEYTFLDENVAMFYERERRTAELMNIFTVIAILIGCMGLLGLVSYMATTRTKEIGVRKVLGATMADILGLFGKELAALTVVAFVVSVPVAWYMMNRWLQDFAYRIDIGPGIFAIAGGVVLLIALATVSWQSVRAALANPVESLRSE